MGHGANEDRKIHVEFEYMEVSQCYRVYRGKGDLGDEYEWYLGVFK